MSATGYLLRQMIDRLEPGAALEEPLPALNRVLYCHRGSFSTGDGASCTEDVAWYGSSEIMVEAGPEGAVVWRWELAPDEIGSASCRERVCHTCSSRWSPYH